MAALALRSAVAAFKVQEPLLQGCDGGLYASSVDHEDDALLQKLSSCIQSEAEPELEALIPHLLDIFALGLAAGRSQHHAVAAKHAAASTAAADTQRSLAMSSSGSGDMLASSAAPASSATGLSSASSAQNQDEIDGCGMASASPHPMSADSTAHASIARVMAAHPGIDWTQPISAAAGASSGCPFMAMLASQRSAAAASGAAPAAPGTPGGPAAHPQPSALRGSSDGRGAGCPAAALLQAGPVASPQLAGASSEHERQSRSGEQGSEPEEQEAAERDRTFSAVTGTPEGPAPAPQLPAAAPHHPPIRGFGPAEPAHMVLPSLLDEFPSMSEALYSKLGSWDGLVAAVDGFYARIMGDERFQHCYEHVPARSYMTRKLSCFLAFACSGRLPYDARTLWRRHSELIQAYQLMPEDVDMFAKHLHDTLVDVGIHPEVTEMATQLILQYRDLFHPDVSSATFEKPGNLPASISKSLL